MVFPFPLANVLEWFFLLARGDLQPAKDRRHHRFTGTPANHAADARVH
jgi:hypothetical protein